MEFSGIKENGGNLRKTEFMELTGTDFDAWIERLPLEDITNYFNYLVAVNEGNIGTVGVGSVWTNVVDSSKENSGGESSIGEKVEMSKSGDQKIHHELKDNKGNALMKGFR